MSKPSGTVYLCKNAIVDRTYSHTIDFKDPNEQRAYWGSLIKYSIFDVTYVRRQRQYIRVDYTLDQLKDVNYLFYTAEENGKLYYCFVTGKEYYSDNTTYIYFETDVLQTYMFDYQVKPSYVLQEHCDRWDANHKPIYSRTEEGLDYGAEYTVESAYNIKSNNDIEWYLAICKEHTTKVTGGYKGGLNGIVDVQTPFTYYLLPNLREENSPDINNVNVFTLIDNVNSGNNHIVNSVSSFMEFMSRGGFGDFVQQIVRLPYLPFKYKTDELNHVIDFSGQDEIKVSYSVFEKTYDMTGSLTFIRIVGMYNKVTKELAEMGIFEGIESAMPTTEQWEEIIRNPYTTERDKRFESKLLTHPYRYNLLTDWKNQPMIIKNEYIGGDKIKVNFTQSFGMNGSSRYWLDNYKKDPNGRATSLIQLTQDEAPVVNDAYYSYLLANKNQIDANKTNAMISGITNVGQGMIAGAMAGGIYGAVGGAITGTITGALNYGALIRSENAKQRDLKNLPDTIINANDSAFNSQDDNIYLSFYRYKICCEFEELLADTFNMTGYTVKRVKLPNLKTRSRFNYIKTVGANIIGSFDQDDVTMLRQIFDNGITFWHYNTVNFKPLDYSLENIETKLLKE